ncbi:uncharacterized protein LOC133174112 [Saccostrea echinata]|uniref:uncharacterized protein LOC133174112 n=1 Tax=Saccostrea echinata TaxID=191078 RepID=UPI002A818A69|nr:uncharacterized protein LOC133174112 [Saccostrea echinata]
MDGVLSVLSRLGVHAQTDKPSVEYGLREKFRGRRSTEELFFWCKFKTDLEQLALYEVYWYLDGKRKFISGAVRSSRLNETYLTEENGIELNRKISCLVKTTLNHSEVLSPRSGEYFAGIKIDETFILIRRGGGNKIRLKLTVPFGCAYYTDSLDVQNCVLNIQMVEYGNCTSNSESLSKCGISIRRNDWNKTHEMEIGHSDDYTRKFLPYRRIQLETQRLLSNEIWSHLEIPAVQVYILDSQISLTCSKLKNGNQNLLIQIRRARIGLNKNRLCGLAVRAGADVFLIDACHFPTTKKFRRCVDNVISVRVWDGLSSRITEVNLLPGTRIIASEKLNTATNQTSLLIYICYLDVLTLSDIILNEASVNLFEISDRDNATIQRLMKGSLAVCTCRYSSKQAYFIDYDPLTNSTICTNSDNSICHSSIKETTSNPNFCKIVKRNPEWVIIFKATAGNGERVYDAWSRDLSKLSYCTPELGCLPEGYTTDTLSPTSRHLTSQLIKQWNYNYVQKVKLELYTRGTMVLQLIFDAENSNNTNWFSNDRLLYSSYQDMHRNSVYNYFSIRGFFEIGGIIRRFHINSKYDGCPGDIGWLTVVDSDPIHRCSWESSLPFPQMLYAKGKVRNWNSGDIGHADTMAIYIFK